MTDPHRGIALVTGSAGAIGSATVCALSGAGYEVIGLDLSEPAENSIGHHYKVDVRDQRALEQVIRSVRVSGRLRHVISIAGGALPGEPESKRDLEALDPDLFRRSLEANLTSHFLVARASLPWLMESGEDRSITFTSSFNALSAQGMPAYSAAKAGIIGLMHSLVDPLGKRGIRVNVVAPGTIRTPRTERLWQHKAGHFEGLEQGTALGRLGTPADVAEGFVALTSLRHVTGQVLVVDGGQLTVHR